MRLRDVVLVRHLSSLKPGGLRCVMGRIFHLLCLGSLGERDLMSTASRVSHGSQVCNYHRTDAINHLNTCYVSVLGSKEVLL